MGKKQAEENWNHSQGVDRWRRSSFSIRFSRREYRYRYSIVDQRDWVRTRRTYYKMRELFLDWRKNIARSPHAPMLLSELRRDDRRRRTQVVADVRCMYVCTWCEQVLYFKRFCAFSKLRHQTSPPRGEISPMWLYHQVSSDGNSEKHATFAEVWLFDR